MSITPDFIRILFVECASRQARVSIFFVFSRIVSGIYIVHWVGCHPTSCPVPCGIPQSWCPVLGTFNAEKNSSYYSDIPPLSVSRDSILVQNVCPLPRILIPVTSFIGLDVIPWPTSATTPPSNAIALSVKGCMRKKERRSINR